VLVVSLSSVRVGALGTDPEHVATRAVGGERY
jgi:hypothetical protein